MIVANIIVPQLCDNGPPIERRRNNPLKRPKLWRDSNQVWVEIS